MHLSRAQAEREGSRSKTCFAKQLKHSAELLAVSPHREKKKKKKKKKKGVGAAKVGVPRHTFQGFVGDSLHLQSQGKPPNWEP